MDPLTPTTRELRKYLLALGGATEEYQNELKTEMLKIVKTCCKEDKSLAHLQLFFHLPFKDELEPIFEDPKDFEILLPGPSSKITVSPKMYADFVVQGDLISHFLQALHTLRYKEFMTKLTSEIVEKLTDPSAQQQLLPIITIMVSKIIRDNITEVHEEFYMMQFKKLLKMLMEHPGIEKYEKFALLMRIAGISCMTSDDYGTVGSELMELIEEWNFDSTHRPASETKKYLKDLFESELAEFENNQDTKMSTTATAPLFLEDINEAIESLSVSDETIKAWKNTKKTHRMNWLEFIGVHCHLTTLILKKNIALDVNTSSPALKKILEVAEKFANYKPKLTRDDFLEETANFKQFYTVLKRFGDKDRDRKELLLKFLDYSYAEIFLSNEGLRIADKYLLPGANYEIALKYVEKALGSNINNTGQRLENVIPGMVKLAIIKLLNSNEDTKSRRNDLVSEIFKDGSHSQLCLTDFKMHLNHLCSKIGHIEKEKKTSIQAQEHNLDLIYYVCIQDPKEAIESLMRAAILSQHCRVLLLAKQFLRLSCRSQGRNSSVRNVCFGKIIDSTDELDPFFESLASTLPNLIGDDIMDAKEMFQILKTKICDLFLSNILNLKKIFKLMEIVSCLYAFLVTPTPLTDTEATGEESSKNTLLQDICSFALNIQKFSFRFVNLKTFREMLIIRSICTKILSSPIMDGSKYVKYLQEAVSTTNDFNILEVGLIYINLPMIRTEVQNLINEDRLIPGVMPSFSELQDALAQWILNVDMDSWPAIIEFIIDVIYPAKSNDGDHEIDLVRLFNFSLLLAWDSCLGVDSQVTFRQCLKFHQKSVSFLIDRNLLDSDNQLEVVSILVILANAMQESMKRRKNSKDRAVIETSIQQVMLTLLEEVNLIMDRNKDFLDIQQGTFDRVFMLPVLKGGTEPIRKCVIDRIAKYGYNPPKPDEEINTNGFSSNGLDHSDSD